MRNLTKAILTSFLLLLFINELMAEKGIKIISPDKQLSVSVLVTPEGRLAYSVKSGKVQVLNNSGINH